MSPEQFRGESADARADIFSLCVTLWEALFGERPFVGDTLVELSANVVSGIARPPPRDPTSRLVPRWLRRVCLRGLAVDAERRFASMHELLAELEHGHRKTRTRRWLAAVAAVVAVGLSGVAYQRYEFARRAAACEVESARVFDVWDDAARAEVRAGLIATGVSYARTTAEKLIPVLDAEAESWRDHRRQICRAADIERTLDAERRARAEWCLDELRMEFAALLNELKHADDRVVQKAVVAAADLAPVMTCTKRQALVSLPAPPPADARPEAEIILSTLSRARAQLAAGHFGEGLEQTRVALQDAEALGWPPLSAAARRLEGKLLDKTGAQREAEAASVAAYMEAAKVNAWSVAFEAATDLSYSVGYRQPRPAEGAVWAQHAEVAALLAGDPLGLREASRLNNLAAVRLATGAYAEAQALYERSLALREDALGRDHPKVAVALNNLATLHHTTGAYDEGERLSARALAIRERALGPDHPDVANTLNNLANNHLSTGEYDEARALYERALTIREDALGPRHREVAMSLSNLANVHLATGARVEATALYERSLAIREQALGPDHPDVAESLNNLALALQDTDAYDVRPLYERALAIREQALGPDHPVVAGTLSNLSLLLLEQSQPAEAIPLLERALVIFTEHESAHAKDPETRFALAQALVATDRDRARAMALADEAVVKYRDVGDIESEARVEEFLAGQRGDPGAASPAARPD